MQIQFKDTKTKVISFFMKDTFSGHIEGTYESVSKQMIATEYEQAKKQRQGYLLLEPCLVENNGYNHCLKNFRYEVRFEHLSGDSMSVLTLVFFDDEPKDNVSLTEFLSAITRDLLFYDVAETYSIFDD